MEEKDPDYELFVDKIKKLTGIDLAQYKEAQMKRRLTTLRMKKGHSSFASFFEEIAADKNVLYEFLDRMTINVSEFWRNPNRWEVVEQKIVPDLLKETGRIKCWSAACSTGEEPYTLAMILAKHGVLNHSVLLATDIDEGALAKAKAGIYAERSLRDVPAEYINAYFRPVPDQPALFHVSDTLKQAIKFQRQNLLTDLFDSHFDLIVCRNVMIYFTEEAKSLLYQKFSNALRPGGVLFVGSTEQIFSPGQYGLEPADTFFYRKTP